MKKRSQYIIPLFLTFSSSLWALQHLESISIVAEPFARPSQLDTTPLLNKTLFQQEGIENFSAAANTSVYKVLDATPNFNVEMIDPYGLSGATARGRGIDSNFLSYTLEGVPVYSIRPIGPRDGIYDLENIETIELSNGGLSPQNASGIGSKGGLVNLVVKKAQDKEGVTFGSRMGGNDFHRLYLRVDSGVLAKSLKSFVSLSHSDAKKFKGYGDLGARKNLTFGARSMSEDFPLELLYSHSDQKRHDFRPLDYEQSKDLAQNSSYEYSNDASRDDYYDFYKRDLRYDDLQLSLKKNLNNFFYSAKLYGSWYKEKSDEGITGGGASRGLQKGVVDASRVGGMVDGSYKREQLTLKAGVWLEHSWLDKYVRRVDKTDPQIHKSWAWLNKNHGATKLFSPYVASTLNLEDLTFELGLRYMSYKEAANDTYLPNNPQADYENAITQGSIAEGGSVAAMGYNLWLPSVGLSYKLQATTEIFTKYAKGYQRPYRYSFAAQYGANQNGLRDKLLAQNKNLQDIVNSWEMEQSHLFDLGIKSFFEHADVMVNLFYNIHDNLLASTYDPDLAINYLQNVGKARIYGLSIQSNYEPMKNLWLFLNPALSYSEVLSHSLRKNEIAETPRWSLKTGVRYRYEQHTTFLNLRYIGSRYSDIENEKKVSSYSLVDLSYNYTIQKQPLLEELALELSIHNVFDTKYIASIASADLLEDTPSYFVGAPRTLIFGIKGKF